MPLLLVFPVAK